MRSSDTLLFIQKENICMVYGTLSQSDCAGQIKRVGNPSLFNFVLAVLNLFPLILLAKQSDFLFQRGLSGPSAGLR